MANISASSIAEILPNLPSTHISRLLETLEENGVECEDDLKHVTEADLLPILKPIQARKLLSAWTHIPSSNVQSMRYLYLFL